MDARSHHRRNVLKLMDQLDPTPDEQLKAQEILGDTPKGAPAIQIAEYIESRNDQNSDGEYYIEAWNGRSNPVILEFFVATSTVPSDDTVPWCAAFLNWCLLRSGKTYTHRADSASFRTGLGTTIDTPQNGDIVVFADYDASGNQLQSGHVGLVESLSPDGKTVQVLGGNQGAPARIKVSIFPVNAIPPNGAYQGVVRYIDMSTIPSTAPI